MASKFCPRFDVGTNSARVSKGTVNPPTPNPTRNRKITNWTKVAARAVRIPATDRMAAVVTNMGFRPTLSPSGPSTRVPHMAPKKTVEVNMLVCSWLMSHDDELLCRTTLRKLSSKISTLSAAKHKPAATKIRRWKGPEPKRSEQRDQEKGCVSGKGGIVLSTYFGVILGSNDTHKLTDGIIECD